MIVCKCIIYAHVLEEPADVRVEEALDFFIVELGVDENGAQVGFEHV